MLQHRFFHGLAYRRKFVTCCFGCDITRLTAGREHYWSAHLISFRFHFDALTEKNLAFVFWNNGCNSQSCIYSISVNDQLNVQVTPVQNAKVLVQL